MPRAALLAPGLAAVQTHALRCGLLDPHSPPPLARSVPPSCGPARHAALLAQGGARAWALDASRPMLDYAAQLAGRAGAQVQFVQGDMTRFTLEVRWPHHWHPVTAALVLLPGTWQRGARAAPGWQAHGAHARAAPRSPAASGPGGHA